MTERHRNDIKDVPRFFATHLGGGMMQARLRQKGWTDEQIGAECARILKEESHVVLEYCGGELEKIESPAWKLSVGYHTAMLILNDREGVTGTALVGKELRKAETVAPKEPVQSWYDKDDIDDYDDLGADF